MQSSGRINCAFKKAEPRDIHPLLCQCGIDFSVLHALCLPVARGLPSAASSVRPSFQHRQEPRNQKHDRAAAWRTWTEAENAIIKQEFPVLTAIGAAAARQQTFHSVSIFFDLLMVVPDAVLDGNIQIAVFPAAVFQKLQQPPADLGTLFHGLILIETQCK